MTRMNLKIALLACAAASLALPGAAGAAVTARHIGGMHVAAVRHRVPGTVVGNNGGHQRRTFYGVGDGGETPRTTGAGGNPGGYSNRN